VFLRPGHADPAFGADAFGKSPIVRITVAGTVRIEGAFGDLVGQKRACFLAQRLAFGRQPDLVEVQIGAHRAATIGQNSSAPRVAMCLPSSAAHQLSFPKSSRQASMRVVKRCSTCSLVKPMAPNT